MGYSESTKPRNWMFRFKKTILLGLFYSGVLFYLCLLARVNILNFKSSFVSQLQKHLMIQARTQASHIEGAFETLTLKLKNETYKILNSNQFPATQESSDLGLPVQSFYICDRQGNLIEQIYQNPASSPGSGQTTNVDIAEIVAAVADCQNGVVRVDETDHSRIWLLSMQQFSSQSEYVTAAAFAWDDLIHYLKASLMSDSQIIFTDPQGHLAEGFFSGSAADILRKAARGIEGTTCVTADGNGLNAEGTKWIVGYCPAHLFNESWPVAVITDGKEIDTAVRAHVEGIFASMVCLFLVMLIFCGFYYRSERRRLILEQQTELSRTTSELHLVATEKRQLAEQLKQDLFFYRKILDHIPVGLYWKNQKGEMTGKNNALAALLNESANPTECLDAVADHKIDREVLTKGIDLMHVPQTLKTRGRDKKVLISRICLRDKNDRVIGMLSCQIPTDILDGLHSGTLCEGLEHGCLAEQWAVPTLVIDAHLKIRYANAAFARCVGKPQEHVLAARLDEVLGVSRPELTRILGKVDAGGLRMTLQQGEKTVSAFVQKPSESQDAIVVFFADLTLTPPQSSAGAALPETSPQTETKPETEPAAERPAEILIVDDVEENRTLIEILITKNACRAVSCGSGQQAIELCNRQPFDLILMDIQMPGMDGFEAMQEIRKGTLNRHTPLIAMTASERREDELTALECGFDDYLSKPINRKVMEQKIWRSLQKARQIKDAQAGREIISFLDGNPDYRKAIEAFVQNLPARLEEMKDAFEARDLKTLSFKVHALKGIGGFAGFSVYTEKAKTMEEAIHEDQLDKVRQQLDEMVSMCLRTRLKSDCA